MKTILLAWTLVAAVHVEEYRDCRAAWARADELTAAGRHVSVEPSYRRTLVRWED